MTLMSTWPAGFLPAPDAEGWEGTPFDNRAVFNPEVGPPMFRRRATAETWQFAGRFPAADPDEQAAFWAFWDEIDQGTQPFLWRDPRDERIRKWVFAPEEPVRTSDISDSHQDFNLRLIRLPSTPWWAALMPPGDLVAPRAAYDLVRGLYHNGTAQTGQSSAIGDPLDPGLVAAHGLSDVRVMLTAGGPALTLLSETLAADWWPAGQDFEDVASIAIFEPGALA